MKLKRCWDDDNQRIEYLTTALQGLQNCLDDGIDVRGYFCWSLLDNWGGSMAFADPENNLSISYTMNMLTGSMLGDQRALSLVETTYKNL